MKNSNPKELNPVYIQTIDYPSNDEINLVDLIKTLFKHKKTMAIVILLTMGLATITILFKSETYTYTTSIEIGTQIVNGSAKPIEPPEALLAKINNIYIPVILKEQRLSNPDETETYEIKTNIPKNSLIVILRMTGSEDKKDIMKNLLQKVSQESIKNQSLIYEAIKRYTKSRLDQTEAELILLKKTDANETEIAVKLNLIDKYSSQLASLRNTQEILPVIQSIEPTGLSRALMLAIAIITSVFLGVFSAFFAEFVSKVKEAN